VVGSVAAALRGGAREPRDLDIVVGSADSSRAMAVLMENGFFPSIPLGLQEVTVLRFFDQEGLEVDVFAQPAGRFYPLFAASERRCYRDLPIRVASEANLLAVRCVDPPQR
jgi:hypothetical protein